MAFHIFTKLTIAAAGAGVLTMGALSAPASAAVFNFSFTTVTGGSGFFSYQPTSGSYSPMGGVYITWGSVSHFRYTPLASALANGTAFITRSLFNGTGGGGMQDYARYGVTSKGIIAWTTQPSGFPYWEVNLISTNVDDYKGKISFSQSSSSGGASEWEAIADWNQKEVIPEPTTIAGSLLGLGGLVAARRNRQKNSKDKLAA